MTVTKRGKDAIEFIENQQVEKVVSGHVYIKLYYLLCENCGANSLRRTARATTYRHTKSNPKFDCMKCCHKSKEVYSKKHGRLIDIEEYWDLLKEEI